MLDGVMRGDAEAGTSGSLADTPASSVAIHLPHEALSSMLRRAVALLRCFYELMSQGSMEFRSKHVYPWHVSNQHIRGALVLKAIGRSGCGQPDAMNGPPSCT